MIRVLIYIKHHLNFLWCCIDWLNSVLFRLLHGKKFYYVTKNVIASHALSGFDFRLIKSGDLKNLQIFLSAQPSGRIAFFKPHGFDKKTLQKVFANPAFLMMAVFDGPRMAGYFFLRCFWNKKCFVGRLIDKSYEGKGIGRIMNEIMYHAAWESGFRCFSTISRNNKLVMKSHSKNKNIKELKELDDDYILIEFVKPE